MNTVSQCPILRDPFTLNLSFWARRISVDGRVGASTSEFPSLCPGATLNVATATNQWRLIEMGYWIVEAKNGALRGVRSELPGDRLSLPAVILHLKVLGRPTEIARQQVDPAQGARGSRIARLSSYRPVASKRASRVFELLHLIGREEA
jgi:hypothetical protein